MNVLLLIIFFVISGSHSEYISKVEMMDILSNTEHKWEVKFQKLQESFQDMLKEKSEEVASCQNEILKITKKFQKFGELKPESKYKSTTTRRQLMKTNKAYSEVQLQLQSLTNDINKIKNKRAMGTTNRGFTALLSHQGQNLGSDQIIKFENIISNVGNRYNPYTGVFTSDTKGLYAFYLHSLSTPGKHVELRLKKNNQEMVVTYSFDKEYYSSSGNMGVIELDIGDTVFVETHGGLVDHGDVLQTGHTSFSGFLISEAAV